MFDFFFNCLIFNFLHVYDVMKIFFNLNMENKIVFSVKYLNNHSVDTFLKI